MTSTFYRYFGGEVDGLSRSLGRGARTIEERQRREFKFLRFEDVHEGRHRS